MKQLSLSEAIKARNLEEFARQQELSGIGPIDRKDFDHLLSKTIKAPRLARRTSRSRHAGGSDGK